MVGGAAQAAGVHYKNVGEFRVFRVGKSSQEFGVLYPSKQVLGSVPAAGLVKGSHGSMQVSLRDGSAALWAVRGSFRECSIPMASCSCRESFFRQDTSNKGLEGLKQRHAKMGITTEVFHMERFGCRAARAPARAPSTSRVAFQILLGPTCVDIRRRAPCPRPGIANVAIVLPNLQPQRPGPKGCPEEKRRLPILRSRVWFAGSIIKVCWFNIHFTGRVGSGRVGCRSNHHMRVAVTCDLNSSKICTGKPKQSCSEQLH